MKLPTFFFLSVLPLLSSCSSMSPEAKALAVESAARLINIGLERIEKHPSK